MIDPEDAARFWSKVEPTPDDDDECWLWLAGKDPAGYGRFRLAGRPRLAHVIAWELEHGPAPAGKRVHHVSRCRNPRGCVRPSHLTLGDQAAAIRARDARGNAPAGARNGAAKLTAGQVAELRAAAAGGAPTRELAARFGLEKSTVTDIVAGRLWAQVAGFPASTEAPKQEVGRPAAALDLERARQLQATGASLRDIAAELGASKSAVARALSRNSAPSGKGSGKDQSESAGKNGSRRGTTGGRT